MLSLKTLPYLHRPPSSPFKSLRLLSPSSSASPRPSLSLSVSLSSSAMASPSAIEHFVLFKVRDATDPSKVDAMITHLRALVSLPGVAHLSAGPILCPRSAAATAFAFTHLLHSRYASKPDLAAYAADPAHVAVVKDYVLPICDDVLALDWVADGVTPAPVPPASAARLTLAKLKDGAGAPDLVEVLASAKDAVPGALQLSYGENFSPARAKGYSVGFLSVFPGVEELDAVEGGQVEAAKEKVRPLLESVFVVDFIASPPPSASL